MNMKKIIYILKGFLFKIRFYKVETYEDVENLYENLIDKARSFQCDNFQWSNSKEMIDESYYLTNNGWKQGKDI